MSWYSLRGPVREAMVHLQKSGRTVMEEVGGRLCIDGRPVDVRRLVSEANSAGAAIAYPALGSEGRRHVGG
ncbi:hypothetical protein P7L68_19605 [Tistrella mobilis]|jgi:hypothetical protein|uniref:hypothetical protein n=1 Tax=Tistrella mobilis TaxID=171437 RepID=UPI00355681D2